MPSPNPRTEEQIQEVGLHLYAAMRQELVGVTQAHRWETQVLRWCMKDPTLRTQILRFIDCLPSLESSRQIVEHLKEYFPEHRMRLPLPLRLGLLAARPALFTQEAVAHVTRMTASAMARFFLAGANLEEAFQKIAQLESEGYRTSVDLLGEATVSQAEADRYTRGYVELIEKWGATLPSAPHVSLKLSSLAFPFDPVDLKGAYAQVHPRLKKIFRGTFRHSGFVNVDMEQYHLRDLVLTLTERILKEEFPQETQVGVVIQAYLKDSEQVTRGLLKWVNSRKVPITIRLVRGAYWDTEVILSRQLGWPCPVYTTKRECDVSFERLTDLLFEHHEWVRIGIATHNLRSIARAIVKAKELQVPQDHWEVQLLYGMGQTLQRAVLKSGIPVRIYAPIGELIPGMAYLVRRILENTSHTSFVTMSLMEERDPDTLLESPHVSL